MKKIKLGVSTCLLGENVRYDGGHKKDNYITNKLSEYFDYHPVCPEVECGLSTPREAMRLVGDINNPRLMTQKTKIDLTDKMLKFCHKRIEELKNENLNGFIFKKDSPSSGLYRVKVYNDKGIGEKKGQGIFAREFEKAFPYLPLEEEGRLNDPHLRENFIVRVFSYNRWKEFRNNYTKLGDLVEYHSREKLLLMGHEPEVYKSLGKLVADGKSYEREELLDMYEKEYLEGLKSHSTVKKNTNVLYHILGYFKNELDSDEKKEIIQLIEDYHKKMIPLIVPITLLKHFINKYDKSYLKKQIYLNPHPSELMLRNNV